MNSQLPGACVRAAFVVVMVMTPSLLLSGVGPRIAEATLLVAGFAALFVLVEYGSSHPSLIEFRSAPPFNRARFAVLAVMVVLISLAVGAGPQGGAGPRLVAALGLVLGDAMDFPFSPLRAVLRLMPEGADAMALRSALGLAYLIGLAGVAVFALLIRARGWPARRDSLNVWINLPTFHTGGDVVARLRRDGGVNVLLGIALPYLTPIAGLFVARSYGLSMLENDVMLVWVISLWAFLPVALFLRGLAMRRLALLIEQERQRLEAGAGPDRASDLLPA